MTDLQKNLEELGLLMRPTQTSGPRSVCYQADGTKAVVVIDDEGFPWVGQKSDVALPGSLVQR